jgi:hypothetical protein
MSIPVGTHVLVEGTVKQVDHSDIPYCVSFGVGGEAWVNQENIRVAQNNYVLKALYQMRVSTGDVTLYCASGASQRAHRAVLAAASPVFRAMLYGAMAEAGADDVDCPLIPNAATLDAVLAQCYEQEVPTRVESLDTYEALQLPCELPVGFVPTLEHSIQVWSCYEANQGLTSSDLTRLLESADPRFGDLIARYQLLPEQVKAAEAFLPRETMYLIYKQCACGQGKHVRKFSFTVGSRVRYNGANNGLSPPFKASLKGSIGVITAIYQIDHKAVVRFNSSVCSPNPCFCSLKDLELV